MHKIKVKIIVFTLLILLIPCTVWGAVYWTGKDYFNSSEGTDWGVTASQITKISTIERVQSIDDISSYSAYITNNPRNIGHSMEKAFYWFNKSRLAYVKLFKVKGGQSLSFLFDKDIYLYCAEFSSAFVLLNDGTWGTNGSKITLNKDTAWVMVVFRKVNGDLSSGAGKDIEINSADIQGYKHRYIIFEPFKYTLKLNGGSYMGATADITIDRLGVEPIILPEPKKSGYVFVGWKSENGKIYKGNLTNEYSEDLFKDTTLTASWKEITTETIQLDREYVILEENDKEKIKLNAVIYPADTLNKTVTYSSSDTGIAKVDSSGIITAGKTGLAIITAKTPNGKTATCKVYVMSFKVTVPDECTVNQKYSLSVEIYNNGEAGMKGRKHVIIDSESEIELIRCGDENTKCLALAETSGTYNGNYVNSRDGYLANLVDSKKIYYRLSPESGEKKSGDYKGNITFTVTIV